MERDRGGQRKGTEGVEERSRERRKETLNIRQLRG